MTTPSVSVDTLAEPMTRDEFRSTIREIADSVGLETSITFDSLGEDNNMYAISSYGLDNFSLDDAEIEDEMETFREILTELDVETGDVDDDAASYKWFTVEYPNISTDAFDEFVETVEDIISDRDTLYYNIDTRENLERVRVSGGYNAYRENQGPMVERVERLVDDLEDAGMNVSNWDVLDGSIFINIVYNRDGE